MFITFSANSTFVEFVQKFGKIGFIQWMIIYFILYLTFLYKKNPIPPSPHQVFSLSINYNLMNFIIWTHPKWFRTRVCSSLNSSTDFDGSHTCTMYALKLNFFCTYISNHSENSLMASIRIFLCIEIFQMFISFVFRTLRFV